jgi:hypothetical protein
VLIGRAPHYIQSRNLLKVYFFLVVMGFALKDIVLAKQALLSLEPYLQSIFLWLFWGWSLIYKLFVLVSLQPQSSQFQPSKQLGATGARLHGRF